MTLPLMLLPLILLFQQVPKSVKTAGAYSYDLTVNSQTADAAVFDLTITGYSLTQKGEKATFRMNKKNLKTPYQLSLKNGRYTIRVASQAKSGGVVSKVQGMQNGKDMGSASNDDRITILEVGPGGQYAARGE
jgi:hypothetical protein